MRYSSWHSRRTMIKMRMMVSSEKFRNLGIASSVWSLATIMGALQKMFQSFGALGCDLPPVRCQHRGLALDPRPTPKMIHRESIQRLGNTPCLRHSQKNQGLKNDDRSSQPGSQNVVFIHLWPWRFEGSSRQRNGRKRM